MHTTSLCAMDSGLTVEHNVCWLKNRCVVSRFIMQTIERIAALMLCAHQKRSQEGGPDRGPCIGVHEINAPSC